MTGKLDEETWLQHARQFQQFAGSKFGNRLYDEVPRDEAEVKKRIGTYMLGTGTEPATKKNYFTGLHWTKTSQVDKIYGKIRSLTTGKKTVVFNFLYVNAYNKFLKRELIFPYLRLHVNESKYVFIDLGAHVFESFIYIPYYLVNDDDDVHVCYPKAGFHVQNSLELDIATYNSSGSKDVLPIIGPVQQVSAAKFSSKEWTLNTAHLLELFTSVPVPNDVWKDAVRNSYYCRCFDSLGVNVSACSGNSNVPGIVFREINRTDFSETERDVYECLFIKPINSNASSKQKAPKSSSSSGKSKKQKEGLVFETRIERSTTTTVSESAEREPTAEEITAIMGGMNSLMRTSQSSAMDMVKAFMGNNF